MISIFKKELGSFFSSATGYLVIGIFLALTGLFLWVIPGEFNILESGYANVDGLFYLAPWLFLFLCPAITMRSFAEDCFIWRHGFSCFCVLPLPCDLLPKKKNRELGKYS